MRKRFFFPLFVLFVFFPLIIYLVSYTRFFNNEVRNILLSVVDDGTNAKLHLGEIHGSVFGSFTIDGAALLYHGKPIAMVDTVRVSHLPLSLITKTIQATNLELVNPRFFLIRSRDGTFNVDHIGKPSSSRGGRFDWTILGRSVTIRGGQFTLYDSTVDRSSVPASAGTKRSSMPRFDPTDFTVKGLDLNASARLSGDNLSVNMKKMSLSLEPVAMKIDSLSFTFFTSQVGTEVSGFTLRSGKTQIHIDVTLGGQDLLDSLNIHTLRRKYFTASVQASNANIKQVKQFLSLPIDSLSGVGLSVFASGTIDSFSVKQCLVRTDSSVIPAYASFEHITDSSMTMNVSTSDADLDMKEMSTVLRTIGFPNARGLGRIRLSAAAVGSPRKLSITAKLSNDKTEVSAESLVRTGGYSGSLSFSGLDLADILGVSDLETALNGTGSFDLTSTGAALPDGSLSLSIDSSSYDHTAVPKAMVEASSGGDSMLVHMNFLTSSGNVDGEASLNASTGSYTGDFSFSELNMAPFAHAKTLKGDLTGRLVVKGRGFNVDSMQTQLSLLTERSSLGSFNLGNSAFTFELNTERVHKSLQVHSPFFDASVDGDFIPHRLPGELSGLFAALADSFSTKFTGAVDTSASRTFAVPDLDASIDLDVKDARIMGQLLGIPELSGSGRTHFDLVSNKDSILISGFCSSDSLDYAQDSVKLNGSRIEVGFDYRSGPGLSVWDSGEWSTDAAVGSFSVGTTRLFAKTIRVKYSGDDSLSAPTLSVRVDGGVDTLVAFNVNALATVRERGFSFLTDTLNGDFYGIPLSSESPVHIDYSPETFRISPATFTAQLGPESGSRQSRISVQGSYSLRSGADLHFMFENAGLRSIEKVARLDTSTLRLNGQVSGWADLKNSGGRMILSLGYNGRDVEYNGAFARLAEGRLTLSGQVMTINAELSKESDSANFALKLDGTVPLSSTSPEGLHIALTADSLNISFLAPFMSGVEDFAGTLSGQMNVSGRYSTPEMNGKMNLTDGRIRLAANEVDYLLDGTIQGEGNKLFVSPMRIRNVPGQTGGTMNANGSITIGQNTIQKFDLVFDGSILVLNSSARRTVQGIYGSAIMGAGSQGLRLGGSLDRPMLSGTLNIRSADLTLLPTEKKQSAATQEIIYHFPQEPLATGQPKLSNDVPDPVVATSSGSIMDSLRYDLEVETRDNVNLRLIFDPATNEELSSVLGGRLHLSNLSGNMELTGEVNVQNSSYYNFYGRHFASTGKLGFTGNPLNPTMDINAQYQGELISPTDSTTQNVLVTLGITGTFEKPNAPDITLTVNGIPYQGDAQTNAISFILTNEFVDDLTSQQRRSVADNVWTPALSAGTSVLSGALTNLFSREFSFIKNAELRYKSIQDLTNPDVAVTTQFGRATIRFGGQIFSSIGNADVSVDYPLTDLLGNMLYLQLSRKTALNNQTYSQREMVNALRLFYQLSF